MRIGYVLGILALDERQCVCTGLLLLKKMDERLHALSLGGWVDDKHPQWEISGNFREFFLDPCGCCFREFPGISGNFREFPGMDFFLKVLLQWRADYTLTTFISKIFKNFKSLKLSIMMGL